MVSLSSAIEQVLSSPNVASKHPIYERYDKDVQGNTPYERGHIVASMTTCFQDYPELSSTDQKKAVTVGTGGNPHLAEISPKEAAIQATCQGSIKVLAVGGVPLALTDCLNFGNPEIKGQMGAFVEGIEGVKEAAQKLSIPVVSGNVSLYNDYDGRSIPPSALVSVFGRVDDPEKSPLISIQEPDLSLVFLSQETVYQLGGSEFMAVMNQEVSDFPSVNLPKFKNWIDKIPTLIQDSSTQNVQVIEAGGLIATLVTMLAEYKIGAKIQIPESADIPFFLFGEPTGLVIATTNPLIWTEEFGNEAVIIGKTQQNKRVEITQKNKEIYSESIEILSQIWEKGLQEKL